jgi:hypothetical protein
VVQQEILRTRPKEEEIEELRHKWVGGRRLRGRCLGWKATIAGAQTSLDVLVFSVARRVVNVAETWGLGRALDFIIPSTCQNDSWQGARVTPARLRETDGVWKRHRSRGLSGASDAGTCIVSSTGGFAQIRPGKDGSYWSVAALPGIRECMRCVSGRPLHWRWSK